MVYVFRNLFYTLQLKSHLGLNPDCIRLQCNTIDLHGFKVWKNWFLNNLNFNCFFSIDDDILQDELDIKIYTFTYDVCFSGQKEKVLLVHG